MREGKAYEEDTTRLLLEATDQIEHLRELSEPDPNC
jgi:hypothetical protein